MIKPRASFVSALFFVAAVAGGCWLLEELATGVGVAVAHADTIDAAAPAPDAAVAGSGAESTAGKGSAIAVAAGSGSAVVATTTTTTAITDASQLHDVLSDPLGALSDVKSLYSLKLSLAVLGVLIILSRAVARIPGAIGAWFSSGTRATVLAGVAAVLVSVFNGIATGASWLTVLMTAAVAAVALLHPVPAGPQTPGTKAA